VRQPTGAEDRPLGEFTACSNYRLQVREAENIGVKCPECSEGEINRTPFAKGQDFLRLQPVSGLQVRAWAKPVAEKCPQCGSPTWWRNGFKAGPCGSVPTPSASTSSTRPKAR